MMCRFRRSCGGTPDKTKAITCIRENDLSIVAALYDMVGVVGQYYSSYSGHASSYVLVVMMKA